MEDTNGDSAKGSRKHEREATENLLREVREPPFVDESGSGKEEKDRNHGETSALESSGRHTGPRPAGGRKAGKEPDTRKSRLKNKARSPPEKRGKKVQSLRKRPNTEDTGGEPTLERGQRTRGSRRGLKTQAIYGEKSPHSNEKKRRRVRGFREKSSNHWGRRVLVRMRDGDSFRGKQ